MDRGKLLKNILSGSLLLGACLLGERAQATEQATENEMADDFWTRDLGLPASEMEFFKHQIEEGCEPASKLYWAIRLHSETVVKRLLEEGADPNEIMFPRCIPSMSEMPLEEAIGSGDIKIVQILLDHGADVNGVRTYRGLEEDHESTALGKAVSSGEPEIMKVLLAHGANPLWKDLQNRTLLHKATSRLSIYNHSMQIIGLLLDLGLDPNSRDDGGQVPLVNLIGKILLETDCCYCFVWEREHEKLSRSQARENRDSIESACQGIDYAFKILKLLVERGANIRAQDDDGNTLLHLAIPAYFLSDDGVKIYMYQHLNIRLLEELIKLGTDVNLANNEGETPLDLLIDRRDRLENEYDRAEKLLRKHGATAKDDRPGSPNPTKKIQTRGNGEDSESKGEIAETVE
ncbi:MAG: ankyrin repeat domain-containing protein [Puniceicoccales bacterium]|jgi:ankyrin repeat protein|nr:ankyrin repeat domain-containing protein [Puniceicoccales bacterium]